MKRTRTPHRKNSLLQIGKQCSLDRRAVIGQKSLRSIKPSPLIIGDRTAVLSGAVLYLGSSIGPDAVIGHNAIIREKNTIGRDFKIWNNSVVDYGCRIGRGVKIHCNCYVAQFSVLEDNVFLGPGVTLANDLHPGCAHAQRCLKGPHIEHGAQIGAHVTILPGVSIGERALIGAGSVVTKDVPARAVVVGNPGRAVSEIGKLVCVRYPGSSYADYLCSYE